MNWSFQLYTARKFQPWPDVLKLLAKLGYAHVEGFGGVYENPGALREEMDRNGLTMPSGHFAVDALENDFSGVRKTADTLGVRLLIAPYLMPDHRPTDAAGWTAFGKRLGEIGKRAHDAGYQFAWHNHDFEFVPLPGGEIPQRLILDAAPSVGMELDVAWVVRGGGDPLRLANDYADRVLAVHVKDIAPKGQNADEDGWADVGDGTIGWTSMLKELRMKTPALVYALEHDNPSDLERFASRSLAAVNAVEETR